MMKLVLIGCLVCAVIIWMIMYKRRLASEGRKSAGKKVNPASPGGVKVSQGRRNGCVEINGRAHLDSYGSKALDKAMNQVDPRFCGANEWHDNF